MLTGHSGPQEKKKAQTIDMKKGKGEVMEDKNEENNISRRRGKKNVQLFPKWKLFINVSVLSEPKARNYFRNPRMS